MILQDSISKYLILIVVRRHAS